MYYLFSDHLGSTSEVRNSDGTLHSKQMYKAFGEARYQSGSLPTQHKYTGQLEIEFGLVHFRPRAYDPALSRWVQPDSVIPEASQGVLAWDRYEYANNSPIRYNDPSGHCIDPDNCPELIKKLQGNSNSRQSDLSSKLLPDFASLEITGWQVQITGLAAFPTAIPREDDGEVASFGLYAGMSFVFDFDGGFQVFGMTRDIDFNPRLEQGPGEVARPTAIMGGGATLATGPIFGEGFKMENGGTNSYAKQAVDHVFGIDVVSADYYHTFDPLTGNNPDWVCGVDVGISFGTPFTVGNITTYANPLTERIQLFQPKN